ncbi:MAG: hypothetical protein IJB96_11505 [Lachnospira sp.]|nr:hypothetical protein [Lachnospira sp.]
MGMQRRKKNMGRKRKKAGAKTETKKSYKSNNRANFSYSFPDARYFVAWVVAMLIIYAMGIWCIVLGFDFKKNGEMDMYWILLVAGSIIVLTLTAFLLVEISSYLAAIMLGIVLVLMGLVLPILTGYYIAVLFTALIWIGGILIIIDNIAKLTNTTDKGYYKVIFGATGKAVDWLFNWMTGKNPKAKKAKKVAGEVYDAMTIVRRMKIKVGIVVAIVILAILLFVWIFL